MRKTLENNWSRAVLVHQIEASLYERQGKAVSSFAAMLPEPQADLAQEITKRVVVRQLLHNYLGHHHERP